MSRARIILTSKRANIGCGATPTIGWLNFDNSLTVRLAQYPRLISFLNKAGLVDDSSVKFAAVARQVGIVWADAKKGLPVASESLEVIYSSHMLEHLDCDEAAEFLRGVYRALRPGGILRIAVPDLRRMIEAYLIDRDADHFFQSLNIRAHSIRTLKQRVRFLFTGDRDHRWMYDHASLVRLLLRSGFIEAQVMPPGKTIISDPAPLNLSERVEESLYVEALKR